MDRTSAHEFLDELRKEFHDMIRKEKKFREECTLKIIQELGKNTKHNVLVTLLTFLKR